jgi:hypothetical protein
MSQPPRYVNPAALTWPERRARGLGRTPPDFGELCWLLCFTPAPGTVVSLADRWQCVTAACRCPCHHPDLPHVFRYGEWEALVKLRERERASRSRTERGAESEAQP